MLVCGLRQGPFADALHVPLTAKYLLISYTLLPSFMPGTRTIAPILIQGWTLSYEVYFYVLIACAAVCFKRPLHRVLALIGAMGGLFIAARALPASGLAIQAFAANSIVFEFAFGAGIFLVSRHAWNVPRLYTWLGVLGLLATVFVPAMHIRRVLLWGIPSALLVLGAITAPRRTHVYRLPMLLGNASYSIYLIHLIPLYLYAGLLRSGCFADSAGQYLAILGGAVTTVLIGIGVYQWLEKPLLAGLNRKVGVRLRSASS